jgi:hypothetical protein
VCLPKLETHSVDDGDSVRDLESKSQSSIQTGPLLLDHREVGPASPIGQKTP